jgi:hypothetical protein
MPPIVEKNTSLFAFHMNRDRGRIAKIFKWMQIKSDSNKR